MDFLELLKTNDQLVQKLIFERKTGKVNIPLLSVQLSQLTKELHSALLGDESDFIVDFSFVDKENEKAKKDIKTLLDKLKLYESYCNNVLLRDIANSQSDSRYINWCNKIRTDYSSWLRGLEPSLIPAIKQYPNLKNSYIKKILDLVVAVNDYAKLRNQFLNYCFHNDQKWDDDMSISLSAKKAACIEAKKTYEKSSGRKVKDDLVSILIEFGYALVKEKESVLETINNTKKQLAHLASADLSDFNEIIHFSSYTDYKPNKKYIVKVLNKLVNNVDSLLALHWNNGTAPQGQYLKINVKRVVGILIYADCKVYDPQTDSDTSVTWSGWLPVNCIEYQGAY